MKRIFLLFVLLTLANTVPAQNILEALDLKKGLFGEDIQGEVRPTDTLIDLGNAYYEEYFQEKDGSRRTTLQARIFRNNDASKTLLITKLEYDFVCTSHTTSCFVINPSADKLKEIDPAKLLPSLSIKSMVKDTIIAILEPYLAELQGSYLEANDSMNQLLNEIYIRHYRLSPNSNGVILTLDVCDYIPLNEISINPNHWAFIESHFKEERLTYDPRKKQFVFD